MVFAAGLAACTGYLLTLLFAARGTLRAGPPRAAGAGTGSSRLVVLVPAHEEESGLPQTLRALARCEYPAGAHRTIVIADNCTDRTAARGRQGGAEVWERFDRRHGKGHALAWALAELEADGDDFDAVVVLDADCSPSVNMLSAIDVRLRGGADAVQVSYVVANPGDSHSSALRFAAFALMNTVRYAGKQRLGLSCGLAGTGMALSSGLLAAEPWTATGLVEDGEYHLRMVEAGRRAEFAAEASVSSPMPTTRAATASQQERWEAGKLRLARDWSPRLLAAGLAARDPVRIHAALECLVPPQSLIAAGGLAAALGGPWLHSRRLTALGSFSLGAQLAFVLGGLRLVGAPVAVYRALLAAPALIATKLALYLRLLAGRGPTAWVRTARPTPERKPGGAG